MNRICLALLLALLLSSCAPIEDSPAVTTSETTTAAVTTTAAPEPEITVSPMAVEDFLLPLDDFSWKREYDPEYVMIHFTSAVMVDRDEPYNMDKIRQIFIDSGVSINYIIARDGTVSCYIPEDRAAWHAGKGEFAGDEKYTNAMNKYSIGIELAAIGSAEDMSIYMTEAEYNALEADAGFTDAQYESLAALVADICERNSIPMDREHVIGHEEYSSAKNDPGDLFDWDRVVK